MADKSKKESTLYYFTSTGCGFCKKVNPIVEKLNNDGYNILKLELSNSDNVGLKREIEKEYNIKCGTPLLVDANDGNYICGFRDEKTIKKWADGEKIPKPKKPKGPPPPPPNDLDDVKLLDTWKKAYEDWRLENKHVPNLPNSDSILHRVKLQKNAVGNPKSHSPRNIENRILQLEQKIDRLLNHLGVR